MWPRSAAHWPLPHVPWPHPNLVAEVKTEGFDLLSKECLSLQVNKEDFCLRLHLVAAMAEVEDAEADVVLEAEEVAAASEVPG